MSLANQASTLFDRGVRFKGEDLFYGRRIRVSSFDDEHLFADVRGTGMHEVHLGALENALEVYCDCIYFQNEGVCEHLWTAVLEADRLGALHSVAEVRYLQKNLDPFGPGMPSLAPGIEHASTRRTPPWQEYLTQVDYALRASQTKRAPRLRNAEILYCIDVQSSKTKGKITIELLSRTRKKDGDWTAPKEYHVTVDQVATLPDPVDVEIITAMYGGQDPYSYTGYVSGVTRKVLNFPLASKLLPQMAAAGRLCYRDPATYRLETAIWDTAEGWTPWLELRQDDRDQWTIAGFLRRGDQRMDLGEPALILEDGLILARGAVSRFDVGASYGWVAQLRQVKRIPFPDRERDAVLAKLLELPAVPPMEIDEPLRFEERRQAPRLGLRIKQERSERIPRYIGQFMVDYGSGWMDGMSAGQGVWQARERVYLVRDKAAELAARERLLDLGLKTDSARPDFWVLNPKSLPRAARDLIAAGWHVEAEGKTFRTPGATRVSVKSGIDWFELHGEVQYGDTTASLPELLAAVRRGDNMVLLGDGSFGLLPTEWLERFAPLAGMGEKADGHLNFRSNQAALLDALLAAQPDVDVDEVFEKVRQRVRNFRGVACALQPEGFVGQLREYQCEGLGWMQFLREFDFGGCLADDMGVGKTAQVLATLEARRAEGHGPSLVVVPKSVMFNWREESTRFTPKLRVLEYHGTARDAKQIAQHDLVLTTYGTMLRDTLALSKIQFDYVVLDEAQAVKNASTASSKAVRLLRGRHRLALSGTPVENHLGELWSLFEFLNPGMLGEAKLLQMAGGMARNPSEEARVLLAQALRPFILRRTKRQVARELPEKTEQTIFCELEGPQKKQYEELRQHYRMSLLEKVRTEGLGKSKMHVLEALLRLRQAACHPGLIDPKRVDEPSAKLDVLMEQLGEIREEGHKALIFSQFTSLLAIVRRRLDQDKIRYEYLDGATTNRQAHVEAFQTDPACPLFLISLKAGGLGLNLTAAEYVFLLDPWWNPAVEAQAVDRAHRIGQTKPVFAYRLIARDTVEEKVLQLQKTKRDLADAILSEDNSLIRDLNREDLELLLS
jgi:superfamily II DNA or RNA helicase